MGLETESDNIDEVNYEQVQVLNNVLENKIGFGKYQIKVLSVVSFLDFNDGTVFIILSLIMPIIKNEFKGPQNESLIEFIGTSYFIGMVFGSFISGYFSDKYGRRSVMQWCSLGYAIICIYSLFITNVYEIVIQEFLYGINFSLTIPLSTTMYTEISPKIWRSKGVMIINLSITLGQLYSIFLASMILDDINHGDWRKLVAFQAIQGLIVWFGATFLLYESPRYLMQHQKIEEAILVLNGMIEQNNQAKGNKENPKNIILISEEERAQLLYQNEQNSMKEKNDEKKSEFHKAIIHVVHLFAPKYLIITTFLGLIHALITIVCIGLIFTFPTMLKENNFSSFLNISLICFGEFPAFFIISYLTKRGIGRKNSLILFSVIISLSTIVMYFDLALIVPFFICCFCYRSFYILLFTYVNEVYPTALRSIGMGVNNAISRIGATLVPLIVLRLFEKNIHYPFLLFFFVGIAMALLASGLPYETAHIGLDESIVTAQNKEDIKDSQNKKIKIQQDSQSIEMEELEKISKNIIISA
ncbi:hypothetical protein ABPG72_015692 [Tetrahymena utriculariae]